MELPPLLRQAVERALEGVPLYALRAAAASLSERYRNETRDGRLHIADSLAVGAYLATRLPATYAAIRASMAAATEALPDFQPRSLPEFDLYQIFVKDPNGLTIELNFFGMKDVTDWGGENYAKMPQVASMRA